MPDPQEPAATTRPALRVGKREHAARYLGAAILLCLPLYLFRAPLLVLFKLQLLLTERGHWAAPVLLALAWRARLRGDKALALAAALLLLSPALRAWLLAPRLSAETALAWGSSNAPRRPFSPWRLFVPAGSLGIERAEEAFDEAHGLKLTLWSRHDDQGLMTARPVVLILHGGGWNGGEREQLADFNKALARLGWVVAAMDYRLAPAAPWPAQREDILRALEHLRVNARRLQVDPEHVVLLGRSAGAHLALDFAYGMPDPAIRGVIGLYGPADLRYAWQHGTPHDVLNSLDLLRGLCGGDPESKPACFDEASPYAHVTAATPPTLLLHGSIDALVWKEQSRRLDQRLREEGVQHQLVELPWATHAFDWNLQGPGGQAAFFAIERFLLASERARRATRL